MHVCLRDCAVFVCVCVCVCVCARQILNENLATLTAKFEKATSEKLKCQQEAESTERTITLANRLVSPYVSLPLSLSIQ